jgi:hypothetical protein
MMTQFDYIVNNPSNIIRVCYIANGKSSTFLRMDSIKDSLIDGTDLKYPNPDLPFSGRLKIDYYEFFAETSEVRERWIAIKQIHDDPSDCDTHIINQYNKILEIVENFVEMPILEFTQGNIQFIS